LKERRKRRELALSDEKHKDWTTLLNNKKLSKKEKCDKIKEKAKELEEMALRKEQILNVKGNFDNITK
jgi:UDP-2,3-diacylglucosamine pyrophosphatase LpxH